jgi:hypothetical protein
LEQEVGLIKGINEVRIRAVDLTGKAAENTVTIYSDRNGPVIIIEDQVINESKVILSGLVTDDTKITYFIINGQAVPLNTVKKPASGHELDFYLEIELRRVRIRLRARRSAMNVTEGEMHINRSSSG